MVGQCGPVARSGGDVASSLYGAVMGPVLEDMDANQVERLKPLWLALLEDHRRCSPEVLETLGAEESWSRRRRLYREWLRSPRAFVLGAVEGERLVGYALVTVEPNEVLGDTWQAGDRIAELQTLVVDPAARSLGVGALLMRAVEGRLRQQGIVDLVLAVVSANTDAVRFYERHGMTPYLTHMYRRLGDPPGVDRREP